MLYSILYFSVIFLLLFVPYGLERASYPHLANRDRMIVDFAQSHRYNYLTVTLLIVTVIGVFMYPRDALLFAGIFFVVGFTVYLYTNIKFYLLYRMEQLPKSYMRIVLLQMIGFVFAAVAFVATILLR